VTDKRIWPNVSSGGGGTVVQNVFSLVMLAGLLAFLLLMALFWAGLPVERLMLVSAGVTGTATGLLFIGEAVMPRWERAWWKPPPGERATVRLGRLSCFGAGVWFSTGGIVFLGYGWLTEHIVPGVLVAFPVAMVLTLVGIGFDRRQAEAARAAVRPRGWRMTSVLKDDDLPADEAQQRCDARANLQWLILRRLTGRTTFELVEAQHGYLAGIAGEAAAPTSWPGVAEEWQAFRSAFAKGDEIWKFNTTSVRDGVTSGEEGFARLQDGSVVDWFITAVVG
jgi:hypothetical protein